MLSLAYYYWLYSGPLGLAATVFWIWMIVDCARHERDRHVWLWIVLILYLPGALVYFLVRVLPRMNLHVPGLAALSGRRRRIFEAEAAARKVGNAWHHVKLGDLLLEAGRLRRAAQAYQNALERQPDEINALFGLARAQVGLQQFQQAAERLRTVMERDPDFRYGEASLACARALKGLGRNEELRRHLQAHLKKWSHPEARVLLAEALAECGETGRARAELERLVDDMRWTTEYSRRQNRRWVRRAKTLLRRFPPA
jgi:hypothetical protein